jgi:hypothetical protein
MSAGNRQHIPFAHKELVCDMARRISDVGLLAYQTGFGQRSTYKWIRMGEQHGIPALPRGKPGPKFALGERELDVKLCDWAGNGTWNADQTIN